MSVTYALTELDQFYVRARLGNHQWALSGGFTDSDEALLELDRQRAEAHTDNPVLHLATLDLVRVTRRPGQAPLESRLAPDLFSGPPPRVIELSVPQGRDNDVITWKAGTRAEGVVQGLSRVSDAYRLDLAAAAIARQAPAVARRLHKFSYHSPVRYSHVLLNQVTEEMKATVLGETDPVPNRLALVDVRPLQPDIAAPSGLDSHDLPALAQPGTASLQLGKQIPAEQWKPKPVVYTRGPELKLEGPEIERRIAYFERRINQVIEEESTEYITGNAPPQWDREVRALREALHNKINRGQYRPWGQEHFHVGDRIELRGGWMAVQQVRNDGIVVGDGKRSEKAAPVPFYEVLGVRSAETGIEVHKPSQPSRALCLALGLNPDEPTKKHHFTSSSSDSPSHRRPAKRKTTVARDPYSVDDNHVGLEDLDEEQLGDEFGDDDEEFVESPRRSRQSARAKMHTGYFLAEERHGKLFVLSEEFPDEKSLTEVAPILQSSMSAQYRVAKLKIVRLERPANVTFGLTHGAAFLASTNPDIVEYQRMPDDPTRVRWIARESADTRVERRAGLGELFVPTHLDDDAVAKAVRFDVQRLLGPIVETEPAVVPIEDVAEPINDFDDYNVAVQHSSRYVDDVTAVTVRRGELGTEVRPVDRSYRDLGFVPAVSFQDIGPILQRESVRRERPAVEPHEYSTGRQLHARCEDLRSTLGADAVGNAEMEEARTALAQEVLEGRYIPFGQEHFVKDDEVRVQHGYKAPVPARVRDVRPDGLIVETQYGYHDPLGKVSRLRLVPYSDVLNVMERKGELFEHDGDYNYITHDEPVAPAEAVMDMCGLVTASGTTKKLRWSMQKGRSKSKTASMETQEVGVAASIEDGPAVSAPARSRTPARQRSVQQGPGLTLF